MLVNEVNFLKQKGLHITEARICILNTFYKQQGSLTQKEIHLLSGKQFDRVTIYRTLDLFVQKGIIHIIPSINHILRYALLKYNTLNNFYEHHLHFLCDDCGKTICLDYLPVPYMKLPDGFAVKETDIIFKGVCNNCKKE